MANEEQRAMEKVVDHLHAEFPHLPTEGIRERVHVVHDRFEGRPIRDFVPMLVQRSVRDELLHRSD